MRISHRYKFVFISKPRCASTTVRKALDPFSDIVSCQQHPYHHHTTAEKLCRHFREMNWNWDDYHKFVTIRNPWTMLISLYNFGLPDRNGKYFWQRYIEEIREKGYAEDQGNPPGDMIDFSDWLFEYDFSLYTLSHYAESQDGRMLVDTVLTYENLENELPLLTGRLGFQIGPLPHLCSTHPVADVKDFYGNTERRRVEELFHRDIERGRYRLL